MKKRHWIIFVILSVTLAGCAADPSKPYSFRQKESQIVEISILVQNKEYSNWEERFEVIVELDPSQYSYFLEKLSSVKGQPFFNPPGTDFGLYVIRITYIDGEEEFISCDNNAYLRPGKELRYDTYWFSDKDGFDQLIQEFIVCGTEQDSVS